MSAASPGARVTLEEHRQHAKKLFGKLPCLAQAKVSFAQMEGKNVVFISGTGTGKTYTFWLPLIHDKQSAIVIISPLNALASQQAEDLSALEVAGIKAIALQSGNCSTETITLIIQGVYRVVIMPPELVHDHRVAAMWDSARFTSRLARLIFDEAHCLILWGKAFRAAYLKAVEIRWRLPSHVRFYLTSATLPETVLNDCMRVCGLTASNTTIIRRSSDRPNIRMTVRPMKYSQKSCADLAFVVPNVAAGAAPVQPSKCMVFCNTRKETERVALYLRGRLGSALQDNVVWFHSGMSDRFKRRAFADFRSGKIWCMVCTDAAGMGMDVPDVDLLVQWKATPSLCTLWQRMGRAARGPEIDGLAVYIVEKSHITEPPKKKRPRARRDADESGQSDSDASDRELGPSGASPTRAPLAATTTAPPRKRRKLELEPAMDEFINAGRTCNCRRKVAQKLLGNAATDDPYCCERCAPKEARICCDLCCPSLFPAAILESYDLPARTKKRKRFKYQPYTRRDPELQLKSALRELRQTLGTKELGNHSMKGRAFLSDELVDLVVDLAHSHELKNVEDLRYHTNWVYSDQYGANIVAAALRFLPLPAVTVNTPAEETAAALPQSHPLGDVTNGSAAGAPVIPAKKPRRPMRCSKCGMLGHNKANRNCPGSPAAAAARMAAQPVQDAARSHGATTNEPDVAPGQSRVLLDAPAPGVPDTVLHCSSPGLLAATAALPPSPTLSTSLAVPASASPAPDEEFTRYSSPDWLAAAAALPSSPAQPLSSLPRQSAAMVQDERASIPPSHFYGVR